MRKIWLLVLLALAAAYVWRQCTPMQHAPAVLVQDAPRQVNFTTEQARIQKEGWTLKPLATFSAKARVLGIARYEHEVVAVDGVPARESRAQSGRGSGDQCDRARHAVETTYR